MAEHTDSSFYVTGGTLRQDAPSYVERQADRDLLDGLLKGEFCYVLTSRQMGKSSLMVRTAGKLREQGVQVVVLDLTAIGQNLTPEQWYDGLLVRLGRQLDLEDELEKFWESNPKLGPCQRFFTALRDVVLGSAGASPAVFGAPPNTSPSVDQPHTPVVSVGGAPTGAAGAAALPSPRLVLFVDEIDVVRSLPFSTDEFFAAIRECYNRRTEDAEFNRLTFCLLGVASPSDLIRDTRLTPFNIGRRIELKDFTDKEASALAQGLGREEQSAAVLLERVLYWTKGHPYLTQRLCQAIAQEHGVMSAADVDRLSAELFLSNRAKERDDNLLFVRERLLRSEADLASLLSLYEQVRARKPLSDDETNPLVSTLRLSGITAVSNGRLVIRNRIYEQVFDRAWVSASMPGAEVRRQKAAFRRGLIRAAGIAAVILVALAVLASLAMQQARRAKAGEIAAEQNLYAADMKLAHQAWDEGNLQRAQTLLRTYLPDTGREDLRGFEWRYLWKLCRDESKYSFTNFTHEVRSVAFSLDGGLLAVASGKTVTLLDVSGRKVVGVLPEPGGWITALAFSPTATNMLATAVDSVEATDRSGVTRAFKTSQWPLTPGGTSVIKLWNVATRELIATFSGHTKEIASIAFSRDGMRLASASWDNTMRVWDIASQNLIHTLREHDSPVLDAAFSRDGNTLVCPSDGGGTCVELWNLVTGTRIVEYPGDHTAWLLALALSPGGDTLATAGNDGLVILWDFPACRQRSALTGHQGPIESVAFAATGKLLATAGADNTVRVWDVASERQVAILRGHSAPVTSVAFAPDGETLVSGGLDRTVKVWDAVGRTNANLLKGPPMWTDAVAFSPDGKTLASVDYTPPLVRLWDLPSRRFLGDLRGHGDSARCAAFSPDGRTLASGSHDRTVKLWDLATRTETGSLSNEFAVCSVAYSPDDNTLAAAGDGVTFWDVASRQAVKGLVGDTRGVYFVAFSPSGSQVAAGYLDGRVGLWDFASRRLLASFTNHHSQVKSLAFSNDGTFLASGSHDATVVLYNIAGRQYLETLRGHTFIVHGVAFSPDNKTLASASWDGTVKLWNLASRQLALTLRGHPGPVAGVAFARDGNLMATCGADSDVIVRLWPALPFAEIEAAESRKP